MGCSPSCQGNAVVINIVSTASKFTIEESPPFHHFALIFYYPMIFVSRRLQQPRSQRPSTLSTTKVNRKQSTQSLRRQTTAKLSAVKIPDILAALAEPHSDSAPVTINARPTESLIASTVSSASAVEQREKEIAGISNVDMENVDARKTNSRANSKETIKIQKHLSNESFDQRDCLTVQQLGEDYARFLVVYTSTILDSGKVEGKSEAASKPKLESRGFKPLTMDNISVRKLCEVS
jgi:hypothetical protein